MTDDQPIPPDPALEQRAACPDCGAPITGEACVTCPVPDARDRASDADESVRHRVLAIEIEQARIATRAAGDERIPVGFSSEQPVLRYDWRSGERYYEVLDHEAASVDLSYARSGLPFLLEHYSGDLVGRVEDITIDSDRRGRGMLKPSRSARGVEVRQDIEDGIRPTISFGYRVGKEYEQTDGKKDGDIPTRRYKRWTPMEVSSVAVPADASVGIGRSATPAAAHRTNPPAPQARSVTVHDQNTAAQNGAAPSTPPPQGRSVDDILRIQRMCAEARCTDQETDAFIRGTQAPGDVALALFEKAQARARSLADNGVTQADVLGISPKERKHYSLGRALAAIVTGDFRDAGYEREVSESLSKRLGRATGGLLVPTEMELTGTRAQAASVAGTGGNVVPSQMGTLIELLRNKSVIDRLNPMRLPGLQGNVPLPRHTAANTAGYRAEAGAAAVETNMTFDQVTLSPKNIIATMSYYKQLFAQSIIAIDTLAKEDLSTVLALLFDKDCIHGAPAANGITGLYAMAGVQAVAMGGAITFAKVVDMEAAVEAGNALLDSIAYVTTPEIKGKAKQKARFANADTPIWTGGAEGEMNGYRALSSNQIAKNLGVGVNEHGIVYGSFSEAIVADWGAIDITVNPYTGAREAKVEITAHWLADFNSRHPEAFAKGTGLTNV